MAHRRARLVPKSIRGRLLLIVLAAVVATAALVTVVGVQVLAGFLSARLHERIDTIAGRIADVADEAPERVADATALRTFLPAGSLVLLEPRGGGRTVSFGSDALDASAIAQEAATLSDRDFRQLAVESVGGRVLTVAIVRVDTQGLRIRLEGLDEPVSTDYIVFATDVSDDVAALAQLAWTEGGVAALAILAVGLLAAVTLRIGIRPLTTMAATADAITQGDRSQRLTLGAGAETDHLAAAVNRALDAQQVAEDRLRTFLDDVSHELRTPLTTVNGWIDLYLQGGLQDAAERDRAMERVEAEISRMRTLVDELALLSRLDAHRPLDVVPVDLERLAREVVDDARIIADDRDISVDTQPAAVRGDADRLAQVLRNLVGNAVQHTPAGTPIHVSVRRDGQEVVLTVSDEGEGISDADLSHVFERFWRAEPSRSRATGGSGLGLAIVASVVEAHHGAIRVASGRDGHEGTAVTVSLPALPGRDTGERDLASDSR